jgi:acetolactate synthase I/II/III large subunit
MTGKAGVALVTSGPGCSNLVTGFATATSEGDPVVGIGGALIAKTNMPVVRTYQGAGVVPREHFHRFGGRVGLFRTQPADRILDAADLMITIGYDPIEFEPSFWNRGEKRNLIHIDVLSADIDNDYRPQVELIGNIGATVGELIDHVNAGSPASSTEPLHEVGIERTAFVEKAAALNGAPIHPIRLVQELQSLLSDDVTWCLDMGSFHIWLARYLYSFRARF